MAPAMSKRTTYSVYTMTWVDSGFVYVGEYSKYGWQTEKQGRAVRLKKHHDMRVKCLAGLDLAGATMRTVVFGLPSRDDALAEEALETARRLGAADFDPARVLGAAWCRPHLSSEDVAEVQGLLDAPDRGHAWRVADAHVGGSLWCHLRWPDLPFEEARAKAAETAAADARLAQAAARAPRKAASNWDAYRGVYARKKPASSGTSTWASNTVVYPRKKPASSTWATTTVDYPRRKRAASGAEKRAARRRLELEQSLV
jgi:hypothetical protein